MAVFRAISHDTRRTLARDLPSGIRSFAVQAPSPPTGPSVDAQSTPSPPRQPTLDAQLNLLRQAARRSQPTGQKVRVGRDGLLPFELPYESTPSSSRRVDLNSTSTADVPSVGVLAMIQDGRMDFRLAFLVGSQVGTVLVSVDGLETKSGNEVLEASWTSEGYLHHTTSMPLLALPPSPLVLFSLDINSSVPETPSGSDSLRSPVRTPLPISPYPAPVGTRVRYPTWTGGFPVNGWRWIEGEVEGYRDYAGNITKTGTYDLLAHMLITPPPPPAGASLSAGAPVFDSDSGAVVGVMTERRVRTNLAGSELGWAVPAERLFEGFQLPGMGRKA